MFDYYPIGVELDETEAGGMTRRSIEDVGRNALAAALGRLWPLPKTTSAEVRQAWTERRIHKVLLIRPHQGLGDLLLATPLLTALKKSRPDVQLHFLADRYNVGAVTGNERLEKIWTWEKKRASSPSYMVSFIRQLRAERYDLALIVSSHTPSLTSFLLARASGARIVWAFDTRPHYGGANWSRWLASVSVENPSKDASEISKFMALLKPLGLEGLNEPEFHVPKEIRSWGEMYWKKYQFPSHRPVVALFLGGNPDRPDRLWPAVEWVRLARKLINQAHASVLVVLPPKKLLSGSGQPEPGIYEEFSRQLGERLPVFDEPGLKQAAALLSHADLFVCPDGGLMHVAIASRVPTLGLYFGTDPARWVPPVSWALGLQSPNGHPSGLSAEVVYSAIAQRLQQPASI